MTSISGLAQPHPPDPDGDQPPRRVLFLDDDPLRAEIFLSENPDAVWVETVDECVARLQESWDEVHLDHDLGGERFVDCAREDCGMAVVRWLCGEPRPHLLATRFYVHTHNPAAGTLMVSQMQMAGFQVEGRPFGTARSPESAPDDPLPVPTVWARWRQWLRDRGAGLGRGVDDGG